ncbi:MAG: hypothetical protein IMY78_04040 [Chloroflexi bacterium]|nr:hypothetical protein [Chloroflexota bacterium]
MKTEKAGNDSGANDRIDIVELRSPACYEYEYTLKKRLQIAFHTTLRSGTPEKE